jgi:hypothetical protein
MINPKPIKTYSAPEIPTLEEFGKESECLKQMPLRWKKCTAVLACVGVMGTSMLMNSFINMSIIPPTSASPQGTSATTNAPGLSALKLPYTQDGLTYRIHGGGSGSAFYVVHFTEQEAFGILKSLLEQAGLRFGATPPDYSVLFGDSDWNVLIELGLYDEEKNAAIAFMDDVVSNMAFFPWQEEFAKMLLPDFQKQSEDTHFGIFYTYLAYTGIGNNDGQIPEPTDEQVFNALTSLRPQLEADLTEQVNKFVATMQQAGVTGLNRIATPTSLTAPPTTTANTSPPVTTATTVNQNDFLLGDVNGDGKVDISDALEILKYLAKLPSVFDDSAKVGNALKASLICDPQASKPVIGDALEILKHLAKLPSVVGEKLNADRPQLPFSRDGLSFRTHNGGTGSAHYVVHFTEQEALGIINTMLSEAGFNLSDKGVPDYTAFNQWGREGTQQIGLESYDAERNVAIAFLCYLVSNQAFAFTGTGIAQHLQRLFAEQNDEISFGVFYTGLKSAGLGSAHSSLPPTYAQIDTAFTNTRPLLEAELVEQVEAFIKLLQIL